MIIDACIRKAAFLCEASRTNHEAMNPSVETIEGVSSGTNRRISCAAFTLTEILFSVMIFSMVSVIFFSMASTWNIIHRRTIVQAELHLEGKIALNKILRRLREEMVGLEAVNYASGSFSNAIIVLADTDNDGVGDSLKGWGVQELDEDNNGIQDAVDVDGDGVAETLLWELVEVVSPSTQLATAQWSVLILCKNISVPWTTLDSLHTYRPFEYAGADPDLDIGNDGISGTADLGEDDGSVSQIELGNYINTNGIIDHVGEETKITVIGMGLRVLKVSALGNVESVIIYQGTIDPRNWQPLYYKN